MREKFQNITIYRVVLFTIEQVELDLFSQISVYFLTCHSQWNLYFQNGHKFKSAWWSLQQLEHLKECGHRVPDFVLRWEGLVFSFALQYYSYWWWFSVLWELLHLTHLEPWIQHDMVACPHRQQFLHWRTPGFILAPQIVVINLLTLKYLLIRLLVLLLLWTSQMTIQIIDISDLGETLMTHGFDARTILSKIWFCLIIPSILLGVRHSLNELWE